MQSEGSVYVLGTIAPAAVKPLLHLQTLILSHLPLQGEHVTWETWRAFTPTPGTPPEKAKIAPENFVDGEIIEKFLSLSEFKQMEIADDMTYIEMSWGKLEKLRCVVEELQRLR